MECAKTAVSAILTLVLVPGLCIGQETEIELTLETMNQDVRIGDVAFSPDGRELLFVSDRSGRSKLWLMNRDGSGARLVLDDSGAERSAVWSPEGNRIAFLRLGSEGSDIWVVGRDGDGLRQLTDDGKGARDLAWSPDGTQIAFISDRAGFQDIYTVNVVTGEIRQLTRETNPWDEFRWAPAWSPDGQRIAYVSNRSGPFADDLWLVDVATGDTRKVTSYVQVMSNPKWSPDGSYIAFNAMKYAEFWYGDQSDIYVVEMPSRTLRKVPMNTYVSDGNGNVEMKWGPDSHFLYFRYLWEGDANLWSVPVEGGVATKLTYEKGNFRNFTMSPDGSSIAYARSTPVRGDELYRFDLGGGAPVQLTDWSVKYAGVDAPRKITFRSRDGLYILGYLYLPPDFDRTQRYPSLVQVHGGGNNAYGNGFHELEQFFAQQGYVVLAIEYRGSAGHGREFQDLSYGEWAAEQGWDAVAAAEHLESLPYSNGKVGIYGGSYGGIMTMAAVTRDSEPFDAAAPFYGIYDWADAYDHGDRLMQFWIIEGHRGFKPGENPDLYEHTASIRHLDRVDRDLPFLIIHGERDRRAPFQQSLRLVEALEERGNPVEFYSYAEEGHGFRLPKNRVHAYEQLLEHFNAYLKTPVQRAE